MKGKGFDSWRSVGQLRQAIRIYELRNVDELVLLDIGATPSGAGPNVSFVRDFASELFCPVTVGGGVRTLEHIRNLLAAGADKVAINTSAIETPDLIDAAANKFGAQAVVVSIDVKDGYVRTHCGKKQEARTPIEWAQEVEARGAGEILLNAIDRDGTLTGYDTDQIRSVAAAVGIPVVACGGAGTYEHMKEALDAGAHAVAASAMFHFCDSTPRGAAQYLASQGYPTRIAA